MTPVGTFFLSHFWHFFFEGHPWYTGNVWGNVVAIIPTGILGLIWAKGVVARLHRKIDANHRSIDTLHSRVEHLHRKHDALHRRYVGDQGLAVFTGDEAHPDQADYIATNLLDALDQVPNTGDWYQELRHWAEQNRSGRLTPCRTHVAPSE